MPPQVAILQRLVTAEYEGTLFVKLMTVRSDYVLEPAAYRAGARAKSSGAVNFLHPFSVLAQSQGTFTSAGPAATVASTISEKRRTTDYRGKPAGFGADPLTQLLRIGLAPQPCVGPLIFFDGKQRYRLTFSPLGGDVLSGAQRGWGLSAPVKCRLSFQAISGLGGSDARKPSALRGPVTAHFARSNAAGLWMMTGVDVGTVVGEGHIEMTSLRVSLASVPAAPPPARPAGPPGKR